MSGRGAPGEHEERAMAERQRPEQHPRDPQSFTRGDRRALTIVISAGLAVVVGLLALFVVVIVVPAL